MSIKTNIIFTNPDFIDKPYSWLGHIPFAFFLMESLKPGIFVELGTFTGNSYFAFCQAVKSLNLKTNCYAVDSWEGDIHTGNYSIDIYKNVARTNSDNFRSFSYLLKNSFDGAVSYFSDKSIDLLHIDGCHTYEAVKHDFETWLPKISNKGVIILHDTMVRRDNFGVWKFFEEIKTQYLSFQFSQSYGLGVVCVGKSVPEEFIENVKDLSKDSFYLNLFSVLGERIQLKTDISDKENIIKKLRHQIENLQKLKADYEKIIQEKESIINNQRIQIENLQKLKADFEKIIKEKENNSDEIYIIKKLKDEISDLELKLKNERTDNINNRKKTDSIKFQLSQMKKNNKILKQTIQKVEKSASYKLTKPLRYFKKLFAK